MSIQDFLQATASGNALEAQTALADVLSAKAFESLQDRKVELAQNLFNTADMNEEVELDEGIDTHIKMGKKVKNSDGGHDQTVHYKGKKIGHIGSYEHPSGTKYYAVHHDSESDITGSRSAKEALGDLRALHADHLRPFKD